MFHIPDLVDDMKRAAAEMVARASSFVGRRQDRLASFMASSDLLVSRGSALLSHNTPNAHNATAA
jgi:hypothetical protein